VAGCRLVKLTFDLVAGVAAAGSRTSALCYSRSSNKSAVAALKGKLTIGAADRSYVRYILHCKHAIKFLKSRFFIYRLPAVPCGVLEVLPSRIKTVAMFPDPAGIPAPFAVLYTRLYRCFHVSFHVSSRAIF